MGTEIEIDIETENENAVARFHVQGGEGAVARFLGVAITMTGTTNNLASQPMFDQVIGSAPDVKRMYSLASLIVLIAIQRSLSHERVKREEAKVEKMEKRTYDLEIGDVRSVERTSLLQNLCASSVAIRRTI